jgi:hypothetical protein
LECLKKAAIFFGVVLAVVLLTFSTLYALRPFQNTVDQTANSGALNLVQSGLVASDPLDGLETQQQLQSNNSLWAFGGNANGPGAYYKFFEDADALHIGVASGGSGDWVGYYAATPPTNASLVHAVLSLTNESSSGYFDSGLYIRATNQLLNYVSCLAIDTPTGPVWGVVHGFSTTSENAVITPLWVDQASNQPLTRDCTISTNGTNHLAIYLDQNLVYQNDDLSLGMAGPYNFFVEGESQVSGTVLGGAYSDFYVTLGQAVSVTNAPAAATDAELVNGNGKIIASAPLSRGGATLEIANYSYPVEAYLKVYGTSGANSSRVVLGSTESMVPFYGGDVYTFGQPPSTTSTLSVTAQDQAGHDLSGFEVNLMRFRQTVASDYMPTVLTVNNSQTYTVVAYDYGNYVFDHWGDGSTSRVRTISIDQDTSLVAVYRSANSPPPLGYSVITVSAQDSSGAPLTGFAVTLWQDGLLAGVSFTPASFEVQSGATYLVSASDFGNYTFSNWNQSTSGGFYSVTTTGQSTTNLVAVYAKN